MSQTKEDAGASMAVGGDKVPELPAVDGSVAGGDKVPEPPVVADGRTKHKVVLEGE